MITIRMRVVRNDLPAYVGSLDTRVGMAVEKTARDIEGRYKAGVPVDTGNLKSSIRAVRETQLRWLVRAAADYAGYVEFGTRYMSARPAAVPAATAVWPSFAAAVAAALRGRA